MRPALVLILCATAPLLACAATVPSGDVDVAEGAQENGDTKAERDSLEDADAMSEVAVRQEEDAPRIPSAEVDALDVALEVIDAIGSEANDDAIEEDAEGGDTLDAGPEPELDVTPLPGVTVTYKVRVTDWVSGVVLQGVTLCSSLAETSCVVTGPTGEASFDATVEGGTLFELRGDKADYYPFLVQGVTDNFEEGEVIEASWMMASISALAYLTNALDSAMDPTKGQATILVLGPTDDEGDRSGLEGASLAITSAAEHGPKYLQGGPSAGATGPFADDAAGTTWTGAAGFFNIDPGPIDVIVTAEGFVCTPGASGLSSEVGAVSGTIEVGRVSYFSIHCEPG